MLVLAEIDLSGKAAVVTGDSGGLGAESARALAARGAAVVLTARDESKAAGVVEAIHEETPDAPVVGTGRTHAVPDKPPGTFTVRITSTLLHIRVSDPNSA